MWWMYAWWLAMWVPVVPREEESPMRTRPADELVAELMADLDRLTPTWGEE